MKPILFCLSLLLSIATIAASQATIIGKWYTTDKGAIVEIYPCGSKLCGKIIWLKEPNKDNGTPKADENNPDKAKQNNPIIGLNILTGFMADGDNKWGDGEIYDPENGKTYSCNMTLKGEVLEVRGYIGFSLLGRTEKWTRAL